MSIASNAEKQPATSPQAPLQPQAGAPPTSSSLPGERGRETQPSAKEVAELVYRLWLQDLRRERERLKGW